MSAVPTRNNPERVLTVPNALSMLRIACIPIFAWLVLGPEANGWAVVVLLVAGVSDYLDGVLARRWGQETALGRLLDPVADRLTSLVVPVVLALRDIVPWWFVIVLFARDVVVAVAALLLLRRRKVTVDVHYLGKAATFCLLVGLPLLLLGTFDGAVGELARVFGWAFTVWGAGLYWWSAATYIQQIRVLARKQP
jgi:cardiolipin synthase